MIFYDSSGEDKLKQARMLPHEQYLVRASSSLRIRLLAFPPVRKNRFLISTLIQRSLLTFSRRMAPSSFFSRRARRAAVLSSLCISPLRLSPIKCSYQVYLLSSSISVVYKVLYIKFSSIILYYIK